MDQIEGEKMSLEDAAEFFKVRERTIQRWATEGRLGKDKDHDGSVIYVIPRTEADLIRSDRKADRARPMSDPISQQAVKDLTEQIGSVKDLYEDRLRDKEELIQSLRSQVEILNNDLAAHKTQIQRHKTTDEQFAELKALVAQKEKSRPWWRPW